MRFRSCFTLGLAMALAGCGGSSTAPMTQTTTTTTTATDSPLVASATIDIPPADYAAGKTTTNFTPSSINLAVGGTITWTNHDLVGHTTKSSANLWDGEIGVGGNFTRTFPTAGTYDYICTIHAGMGGTITVK